MDYLKPGEKPDPKQCSHSHARTTLLCSICSPPSGERRNAAADTEATMRRVMDKWLRGS